MQRMPLTADQQVLAARYVPLAMKLARPVKVNWPRHADEFNSVALFALVESASKFDPEMNVRFATYARYRILGALIDLQKKIIGHLTWFEDEGHMSEIDWADLHHYIFGQTRVWPEEDRVNGEEWVERQLRRLPPKMRAVCRSIYLDGKTVLESGEAAGLSASRVSNLHSEALEILRHCLIVKSTHLESVK